MMNCFGMSRAISRDSIARKDNSLIHQCCGIIERGSIEFE